MDYGSIRRDVDYAIIGTGSAGSMIAYHLARAGYTVVVLEKGAHYAPEELKQREIYGFSRVLGPTTFQPATGKHTRLSMLQGQCYGGSTISCDGVSWNLPRVIREDWERMGLKSFSLRNRRLDELQDEVRKDLEINRVEDGHHNINNQLFKYACDQVGLECPAVERNRDYCMRCGYCAQGCIYGLKADAAQTHLKWMQKYDADVYTGCDVRKIHVNYEDEDDLEVSRKLKALSGKDREAYRQDMANKRWEQGPYKFRLECTVADRKRPRKRKEKVREKPFAVLAHAVVISAGTINSSRILFRSGINPNGQVGKRFTAHPTSNINGLHPNLNIDGFGGLNDSYECTHFAYDNRDKAYYDPERHGFMMEAVYSLPWGIANLLPGQGEKHLRFMKHFRNMQGIEVIMRSDAYGEITEDEVRYDISERDNRALLFGTKLAARLMLKVGAREIYGCHNDRIIRNKDDIDPVLDNEVRGRKVGFMTKQVVLHTGHPFGGNSMGVDPNRSVVDETGEHHHIKRLYVCDGSVFPSAVGVNPHLSISIVARKTVDHLLQKVGTKKKGSDDGKGAPSA